MTRRIAFALVVAVQALFLLAMIGMERAGARDGRHRRRSAPCRSTPSTSSAATTSHCATRSRPSTSSRDAAGRHRLCPPPRGGRTLDRRLRLPEPAERRRVHPRHRSLDVRSLGERRVRNRDVLRRPGGGIQPSELGRARRHGRARRRRARSHRPGGARSLASRRPGVSLPLPPRHQPPARRRGPLPRQARVRLIARYGRIGEETTSFESGVSWEELDSRGFKLRLSELERGAVNVVVQPGPVARAARRPHRPRVRRGRVRRGARACGRAGAPRAGARRPAHLRRDRRRLPVGGAPAAGLARRARRPRARVPPRRAPPSFRRPGAEGGGAGRPRSACARSAATSRSGESLVRFVPGGPQGRPELHARAVRLNRSTVRSRCAEHESVRAVFG